MDAPDLRERPVDRGETAAVTAVHADFGGPTRRSQNLGLFRLRQCVGLGNLMCTWGDAFLYAEARGLPMVWPTWPQISREAISSGRTYFRLFQNDGTYLSGAERFASLRARRRNDRAVGVGPKLPYNVDWRHGTTPERDHAVLAHAVRAIVPDATRRRVDACTLGEPFVAVHVRRGDFSNAIHHARDGAGRKVNQPVPIAWYVDTLRRALGEAGVRCALVVSDGTDAELAPLAAVPGVTVQRENALVDLLTASRAAGFIASGSTFSQWIAYLGQMPTWVHPDFSWCDGLHLDPTRLLR